MKTNFSKYMKLNELVKTLQRMGQFSDAKQNEIAIERFARTLEKLALLGFEYEISDSSITAQSAATYYNQIGRYDKSVEFLAKLSKFEDKRANACAQNMWEYFYKKRSTPLGNEMICAEANRIKGVTPKDLERVLLIKKEDLSAPSSSRELQDEMGKISALKWPDFKTDSTKIRDELLASASLANSGDFNAAAVHLAEAQEAAAKISELGEFLKANVENALLKSKTNLSIGSASHRLQEATLNTFVLNWPEFMIERLKIKEELLVSMSAANLGNNHVAAVHLAQAEKEAIRISEFEEFIKSDLVSHLANYLDYELFG